MAILRKLNEKLKKTQDDNVKKAGKDTEAKMRNLTKKSHKKEPKEILELKNSMNEMKNAKESNHQQNRSNRKQVCKLENESFEITQ